MIVWHVDDVMTRDVVRVGPEAGYAEIAALLVERGVSALPVVDDSGRVLGVVSEADLLPRVEGAARRTAGPKAHALVARELMTAPAVTIRPDAPIATAARLIETARVKRLPVVDDGRLVGIVSRRDLLRGFARHDDEIRADIAESVLRRDLWIDPSIVDITVADGVVTLDGRVESRSLAGMAVRLTAAVPGVVAVVDRLRWVEDDSRRVHARGYAFGTPEELVLPSRRP